MPPTGIERLAAAFWDRVGGRPAPPRDLEAVIWQLGTVWIWSGHPITPDAIRARFRRRGIALPKSAFPDCALHGMIVAHRGSAEIAVDDQLAPDLRRMIVAHEFGHYLAEYLAPRERVLRRLGSSILPVLDGDRPATQIETWAGALAGVKLGFHSHVLERGFIPDSDKSHERSEQTANDLAFELLAPWREVLADAPTHAEAISVKLVQVYGIPPTWTRGYARRLAECQERRRSPSARWGFQ